MEDSAQTPKIRFIVKSSLDYESDSDEEMRLLE